MTTTENARVVDADGHVLEPADTWLNYLERPFRGFAFLAIDVMAAFTQMLAAGMFERYPDSGAPCWRPAPTGSPPGWTGSITSTRS